MTDFLNPLRSLKEGHWFKLICGASSHHLPAIRNLTIAYAVAGADCIDVAADPAIISTAREALAVAGNLAKEAQSRGFATRTPPWLMVSLNDGEDPHFRKAEFSAAQCPIECLKPCESICPANAIVFDPPNGFSGVVNDLCYGCGRCLPICPIQHISTRPYVYTPEAISPLILQAGVDAIEIHTQPGRLADFERLWKAIGPQVHQLKLVAISCPDGEDLIDYLWAIYETISPLPCHLIWQTDGRPMSGDIGNGATRAAIRLGQKVLAAGLPGYIQLAGGTNGYTVPKLRSLNLLASKPSSDRSMPHCQTPHFEIVQTTQPLSPSHISGVAYGSYARALLSPILEQLEAIENIDKSLSVLASKKGDERLITSLAESSVSTLRSPQPILLEQAPNSLQQAVKLAHSLVSQLKPFRSTPQFDYELP